MTWHLLWPRQSHQQQRCHCWIYSRCRRHCRLRRCHHTHKFLVVLALKENELEEKKKQKKEETKLTALLCLWICELCVMNVRVCKQHTTSHKGDNDGCEWRCDDKVPFVPFRFISFPCACAFTYIKMNLFYLFGFCFSRSGDRVVRVSETVMCELLFSGRHKQHIVNICTAATVNRKNVCLISCFCASKHITNVPVNLIISCQQTLWT